MAAALETKILLPEARIPTAWYNIAADMPNRPGPPLHPGTKQPIGPQDLAPLFPMGLILQEVSGDRWIDIPGEVIDVYRLWRPTPLYRARRLEKALGTTARLYYKYEGTSPVGSHKPNTAVAQAYYNKKEGTRRIATETGAGQWGSAMAMACRFFDLECTVYMVKVSYHQKPYRRVLMETYGATVHASPTNLTNAGRAILAKTPDSTGSLGIAISEAVEDAATHDDTHYALGSVLNHVLLHQTVVGLEAKEQLDSIGERPDIVIGCVGGGSNFSGILYPFLGEQLRGERNGLRGIAVEPTACPTLTKGRYAYDYGDTARMAPLVPMYTLGHTFVPPGIHAGGLRYHGDAPSLSLLVRDKHVEAVAYHQNPVFQASVQFARVEGIVPAPESGHAVKCAIDEAVKAREAGASPVILFNLCGHGYFDMAAYDAYHAGQLEDVDYPQAMLDAALAEIPAV